MPQRLSRVLTYAKLRSLRDRGKRMELSLALATELPAPRTERACAVCGREPGEGLIQDRAADGYARGSVCVPCRLMLEWSDEDPAIHRAAAIHLERYAARRAKDQARARRRQAVVGHFGGGSSISSAAKREDAAAE